MRLVRLELAGFRAFAGAEDLDLDADAIIISGANGQGKTSIFDAILWALAGNVPRIGGDEHLVSLYSDSGEARVSLELRDADGSEIRIVRRFDGTDQHVLLDAGEDSLRGARARSKLADLLWTYARPSDESDTSLVEAITRSVYLQQDRVREFVDSDDQHSRFEAISELVGAGRVAELQARLDTARKQWKEVTNKLIADVQSVRDTLGSLETAAAGLSPIDDKRRQEFERGWAAWWSEAMKHLASVEQVPTCTAVNAPTEIDTAVRQLQYLARSSDRRLHLTRTLAAEIEEQPPPGIAELESAQGELGQLDREADVARAALRDAESRAAERRRQQVELREAAAELRSLAELALRHLGERCPVCQQEHDVENTRRHLLQLAQAERFEEEKASLDVGDLAKSLETIGTRRSYAASRVNELQQLARDWSARKAEERHRIEELGLPADAERSALDRLISDVTATVSVLEDLIAKGERLALELAEMGESRRLGEYQQQIEQMRRQVRENEETVAQREATSKIANEIWEALTGASAEVVEEQLSRIDPLLRRVYSAIDPHPSFQEVRLMSRMWYGRGRVSARLEDTIGGKATEVPEKMLSSSQVNALAASIFLTLNLGTPRLPLRCVMLDDPMQSLDDINLLGLVDLLRRIRESRQIVVSTHDSRLGALLQRKLRPVGTGRAVYVELHGWDREGPRVTQRELPTDEMGLRIAV